MTKKIVISHFNNVAAILQNNKIEEIIILNNTYQLNDIYLGIVQKIFVSINAAFIKLGRYGKSGFIHISDIKPLKKDKYINHINEVLSVNQIILVQVVKEPTFNKGPRLTANIHLHGKYLVLTPFCNTISISPKIYDDNERTYLHSLALLIKPDMMGLLIKPHAQGVHEKLIINDLDYLKHQWYFIEKTIISASRPILIYREEDLIKRVIRDFYEENIKKIIIDSEDGLKILYYYLNKWNCISPLSDIKLQLYNKSECILEDFFIRKTIKNVLKPKVKLLYGGYIIIESYEAFTIIDVNTGSFNRSASSKEAILKINFYAAIEIAYQMKIRNVNGVIIVDFIDMYSNKDQLQLLEHFNKLLKLDNAKPQIVQFSELGLVELTRRRRGQSLQEIFGCVYNKNLYSYQHMRPEINFLLPDSYEYSPNQLLIYKHIRTLFFAKKFKKNIVLELKRNILSYGDLYYKYFISFNRDNLVNLFNPKANYIVPLVIYLKYVKSADK